MSRAAQKLISASGGKAYEIDQSLMLPEDANAHLMKNYGSAGNRKTWTWSGWVKRSTLQGSSSTVSYYLWTAYDNSSASDASWFSFQFYQDVIIVGGWTQNYRATNRLFRDVGSWMHLVLVLDTTQSTANDRVKLYINGVQETSFQTTNNPSQNDDLGINTAEFHMIGSVNASGTSGYAKLYLAETNFIDGTALTPSSFGETDAATGQWIPKKYTGSYGTNGFYLKYASGAIGTDSSGNGNNYTASNLANSDVLLDTPTNNFTTLNPLMGNGASGITLSQGNLKSTQASLTSETAKVYSTMAFVSGKWYAEVACSTANVYTGHGVVNVSQSSEGFDFDSSTNNVSAFAWGDRIFKNGSQTQSGLNSTASDTNILGIALDLDNGTVQFYSNGSTSGSAETLTRNTGDLFVFCDAADSSGYASNSTYEWNFGQNGTHSGTKTAGGNADGNGIGNYLYSVPSGFLAPCSANLATPTIKKPTEHFNTVLYTGNETARSITGVGFEPSLVWIKERSASGSHRIFDQVRGVNKVIQSDLNTAELDRTEVTAFNSDGFSLSDAVTVNENSVTHVSWNWKAGGSSTTDVTESGSGTSRINASSRSVNTDAGFSIIKYTGSNDEISNGEHTKLNHGLSKAPDLVIIKNRDDTDSWLVISEAVTFNDNTLFLNTDNGTYGSFYVGTTDPDSTYIYLGNADQLNKDGENFICYAWHEVEGYSKFGKYEANNSTNGPFINTGFTPAWIVFKYIDGSGEWWWMLDSTRDTINLTTEVLYPNANSAEGTISSSGGVDFLSNGFKIRATNGGINYTNTYFYMAFAEFPFKYARAR